MRSLRTIWVWMTLLLFTSGVASPWMPAVRAACPMMEAQKQTHCEEAKPAPKVPSCCAKPESVIAPKDAEPGNCCCHFKAAPERPDVPALLPITGEVAALPAVPVTAPLPLAVVIAAVTPYAEDENAPRGPPGVRHSPRAPPLS